MGSIASSNVSVDSSRFLWLYSLALIDVELRTRALSGTPGSLPRYSASLFVWFSMRAERLERSELVYSILKEPRQATMIARVGFDQLHR